MTIKNCAALILAGGRGQRMQTSPDKHTEKCLQRINDKTLANIAFDSIPDNIHDIYISANTNQNSYYKYTKGAGTVISDALQFQSYSGPLAGIASAMQIVQSKWLYVLPADVVFTPDNLFEQLKQTVINNDSLLSFAVCENKVHPLFMLVNTGLKDNLAQYLLDGQRRVQHWVRQNGVACDIKPSKLFFNINTQYDLDQARSLYHSQCL